jgi:hypothetical protein
MLRLHPLLLAVTLFGAAGAPALAQAYPSYGSSQARPSASPDPTLLARAKSTFVALQSGKLDRSQLAANGPNGNMTDATIANAQKAIGGLGPPVSFVQQQYQQGSGSQGNVSAAIYVVTFKNGEKIDFLFAVDAQGKIEGMSLGTPH